MKRILIVLTVLSGTAAAQPGVTPPSEPPPGAQPGEQPGGQVDAQAQAGASINVDELIERVQAASPTIETVARGAFRRARRAIAFGPTAGFWGGGVLAQDTGEYALTFGLALETFKVPVLPTPETLKRLVVERAKAKLKEQLVARFAGREPDPISAEQFAREVWEETVQEILGLENVRPKTMERPAINIALEVNRLFKSETWAPRLRFGFGVWKVTLGASLAVGLGNDGLPKTPVYTGLEIVTHFLLSKEPRSSVVDVFLRADFEMRNRDTNTDTLTLGVRYLLDVI
jgi:hypothetical protein